MKDIEELQNNFEKTRQEFKSYKQKQEKLETENNNLIKENIKLKEMLDSANNKNKTIISTLNNEIIELQQKQKELVVQLKHNKLQRFVWIAVSSLLLLSLVLIIVV